jgi:mono/diheme cytochrome c family protein
MLKQISIVLALTVLVLVGCGPQPTATPLPATPAPTPTAAPPPAAPPPPAAAPTLPATRGELFTTSGICTACHTNMADQAGQDVSTDRLWRASMMANSARDPYWRASVRSEVVEHPDYQDVIEDKCATCHTPMARFTASYQGSAGQLLDAGFFDQQNGLHTLAVDGVSCNLCHQIRDVAFGEFGSFSGHFVIDTELPMGERLAYGPYPVPKGLSQIMQASSGFVPVQGLHIERSELCATCHTLYTPYIDDAGRIAGDFPEQTPYLEWLQSDYRDQQACQDCHMPLADGGVQLSVTGGPPRSPFYKHDFVGGNAYMLHILERFGNELAVTASVDQFQAKRQSTMDQLQNRTATLNLQDVALAGGQLTANVVLASQVGHKYPSGFPSRRVWLHLRVEDGQGQVVFESGAVQPDGSIAGNDNDDDPARFEPHHVTIDSPDQVQIYEAIMGDPNGEVTTILLRGAGYLKDNRLLPAGFDKSGVDPDVGVYGAAAADADFQGGGDQVRYTVALGDAAGPFTVTAELLYQTIGYRWAQKARAYEAEEAARFLGYYEAVPNEAVVVASAQVTAGE